MPEPIADRDVKQLQRIARYWMLAASRRLAGAGEEQRAAATLRCALVAYKALQARTSSPAAAGPRAAEPELTD
jgi:hypothetical protein